MAESAILTAVKAALGVTGTFTDNTITVYINEVMDYMSGAGVSADIISVKATTEEKLGFTGEKKGIAAHAVCLLTRK